MDFLIGLFPSDVPLCVFAAIVLIPLLLNGLASRLDFHGFIDAFGLSVMLVMFWAITNLMGLLLSPPESKALHPLVDFIGLSASILSWRGAREPYKLVLAILFLAQLGLHATFWVEWATQPGGNLLYEYALLVNITWLCEIVAVSWPGGRDVVGRFLDWSFHRGRDHPHAGHAG